MVLNSLAAIIPPSFLFLPVSHVCKGMGEKFHLAKAGCCPNYSVANRSKRYVIENLLCVENPVCAERPEDG